jgi:peptidoglycan/xylan/chitin deacetylase (PgdA/CDA1 family)
VAISDEYLNRDQILKMKSENIIFGSHTKSHPILTEITIPQAMTEIFESKKKIESILGEKVMYFAYPKGKNDHFNESIIDICKKAGYMAAFTTENDEIRENQNKFKLARIGIRQCPLFVFKTRVSGIYESVLFLLLRKLLRLT